MRVQDVEEAKGKISESLLQRLVLKPQKIQQLADGIRAIAAEEEPIRRVLQRTEVAEGWFCELPLFVNPMLYAVWLLALRHSAASPLIVMQQLHDSAVESKPNTTFH